MTPSQSTPTDTPTRFQKIAFLFFLVTVTGVFLFMLKGFALTLLMAAVFTGLTYPIYGFWLKRLKRPVLASSATLLLLILVAVIPLIALGIVAYQEASLFVSHFEPEAVRDYLLGTFRKIQSDYPSLFTRINPQDIINAALNGMRNALQYLLSQGANFSLTLVSNVVSFFLMLFMMFYFYMDGERMLARLIRWSPLRDDHERLLLQQFLTVSKATLKGILVIGIIQGAIGAVLFWAVGMHAPIFLGVLMIFASVIPAAGGGLVWFPASLYLLFTGHTVKGIVVLAVGVLVIGTVDNLLRPGLVGKDAKLHDLMVLMSTLGGLGLFGLPGFIIGPILASLFITLWTLYEQVFSVELKRNAQGKDSSAS